MPFLSSGAYSTVTSLGSAIADMAATLTSLGQGSFAPPTTTITLVNGANSNIPLPATELVRIVGPTGSYSIDGFAGGTDGRKIRAFNTVSQTLTITDNATSTAANRILTLAAADKVLRTTAPSFFTISYSVISARWILESTN